MLARPRRASAVATTKRPAAAAAPSYRRAIRRASGTPRVRPARGRIAAGDLVAARVRVELGDGELEVGAAGEHHTVRAQPRAEFSIARPLRSRAASHATRPLASEPRAARRATRRRPATRRCRSGFESVQSGHSRKSRSSPPTARPPRLGDGARAARRSPLGASRAASSSRSSWLRCRPTRMRPLPRAASEHAARRRPHLRPQLVGRAVQLLAALEELPPRAAAAAARSIFAWSVGEETVGAIGEARVRCAGRRCGRTGRRRPWPGSASGAASAAAGGAAHGVEGSDVTNCGVLCGTAGGRERASAVGDVERQMWPRRRRCRLLLLLLVVILLLLLLLLLRWWRRRLLLQREPLVERHRHLVDLPPPTSAPGCSRVIRTPTPACAPVKEWRREERHD